MNDKNLIIVVVGETGSGKSYITREIFPKYPSIKVLSKYTTRKSRVDEANVMDVRGNMSLEEISKMEYQYVNPLNQQHYGFKKSEIDKAHEEGRIPCIDLSSEEAYLKLRRDYPNQVLLLKVVPYFDEETMKDTFEKQGRDPREFEERKESLSRPLTDWAYSYDNMREVINPYFLRNGSNTVSHNIVVERLEDILIKECKVNLGGSILKESATSHELYEYLYGYSKNRPIDQEMSFLKGSQK